MPLPSPSADGRDGRTHRLRRFAFWAAVVGFTFGAIDAAVFALYDEPARGILSAITFSVGVAMVTARWLIDRRRVHAALRLMLASLMVGVSLVAVIIPSLFPTAVLVPLIAVALALPYLDPPAMRKFLVVALVVMAFVALMGFYAEAPTGPPQQDERPLQILSLIASASLFLYLLFQYSQRQKETLDRLRELDVMKSQFLNTAAHELNTPLTPVKLQLRLLRAPGRAELTREQKQSVEILERNVERLSGLVQNVLEVARLQSGKVPLKLETVDLAQVVRESAESFNLPAQHGGVQLDLELPAELQVVTDRSKVTQVVYNLVSNAVKFTPTGGHVTVRLFTRGDFAELQVTDTGLGLTPEQIGRLFRPFVQVHEETKFYAPGTGLGLFISKNVLGQLGGQLMVESPGPNRGSTFSAMIPLAARPEAP